MDQDIKRSLMEFSEALQIPMYLYDSGELVWSFPETAALFPPASIYVKAANLFLEDLSKGPFIYTRFSAVYGCLPLDGEKKRFLLAGPVPMLFYGESDLQQLYAHYKVENEKKDQCRFFFSSIPVQTFITMDKKLKMIHFFLNGDSPKIDFTIKTDQAFMNRTVKSSIEQKYIQNTYTTPNDSLQYESVLTKIVETGNVEELEKIQESFFAFNMGTVANNPLRNIQDLIIALIALVSRAAIRGGLDSQTALNLSDLYIMNTEKAQTREELFQVVFNCLTAYTSQVAQQQDTLVQSGDVTDIIRYIREHTDLPLTCAYLSRLFGYSSSYLSRKFKAETGMGFSAFITKAKLEDAKQMLAYTNKSLSEISFYYCFSSQSHFQNAFKKQYGITPQQYRIKKKQNIV
ncbi:MAG: helix-turn-helix transcriptional regulator [Firmicutes bacterium]|nr:helix-turn-helix transcriptional regulator [Bacillota bacterium]